MSSAASSGRWWENYLVRYFMPSIAGIAIVSWLSTIAENNEFKEILFFNLLGKELNAPVLILLILYGNLFCYIASYPILGFHVTRVIDFHDSTWKPSFLDGYLLSFGLAMIALPTTIFCSAQVGFILAFFLATSYSVFQLCRVLKALKRQDIKGFRGKTSLVYGYTYTLATRRGVIETTTSTTTQQKAEEEEFATDEISEHKVIQWQREVVETYRHMREHGNSAFIFFLELILAALCYLVISYPKYDAQQQFSLIAILFAIWALPAVTIHLLGQVIERRFSWFDRKI